MKSKQFCSVCKEWLEMEVVPTGDGEDDDGVVWYRCPQCQGFLPKLKGTDPAAIAAAEAEVSEDPAESSKSSSDSAPDPLPADPPVAEPVSESNKDLPWDSPADMMASRGTEAEVVPPKAADLPPVPVQGETPALGEKKAKPEAKTEPEEPVEEYRMMLDEVDQGDPRPYRPWDTYEVGDCLMHLAWEDCGVVVAKEDLPGGRQVIKCYFAEAGVVRLIEKAPR
jgi:hypothetical protein